MDRIQPPPNYYGAPFPQNQDMSGFKPRFPADNNGNNNMIDNSNNNVPTALNNGNDYMSTLIQSIHGRHLTVYCTFPDSTLWHDKVFSGIVTGNAEDQITLYDPNENKTTIIVGLYINYIELQDRLPTDINVNKK